MGTIRPEFEVQNIYCFWNEILIHLGLNHLFETPCHWFPLCLHAFSNFADLNWSISVWVLRSTHLIFPWSGLSSSSLPCLQKQTEAASLGCLSDCYSLPQLPVFPCLLASAPNEHISLQTTLVPFHSLHALYLQGKWFFSGGYLSQTQKQSN